MNGFDEKMADELNKKLQNCERLLIGIGEEWSLGEDSEKIRVYRSLYQLIEGKDFFIVTIVTDGIIFEVFRECQRVVAPCGNIHWRQCSEACTKDIWEENEVPDGKCPHCKAPLIPNTIKASAYIEEGYLLQWKAYTSWLAGTLNKRLLILELGVGFTAPTVIRWPFEKTAFFNRKSQIYRIHEQFAQKTEELKDRMISVPVNSKEFFENL